VTSRHAPNSGTANAVGTRRVVAVASYEQRGDTQFGDVVMGDRGSPFQPLTAMSDRPAPHPTKVLSAIGGSIGVTGSVQSEDCGVSEMIEKPSHEPG